MLVETVLPLGKADSGLKAADGAIDIRAVAADAALVERLGFDGLAVRDNKDDPYVVSTLALAATTRVTVATSVAIAFPRSPTVTAMTAWSLARLSAGRFVLGLGSQVKGHIERRFGMQWHAPGPWMRDYVLAIRALWDAWQHERPVSHHSAHYDITLNVPVFTPAPLDCPLPPIHLAAVNPYMCQVAGEVADTLRAHPVCTASYIEHVMRPAVRRGASKAGRDPAAIGLGVAPLIATGPDEATLAAKIHDIRGRIAFYGSTPAYAACFTHHGLEALAKELNRLSRAQRWQDMAALIDDDVLARYAVVGLHRDLVPALRARYGAVASLIEFSIPVRDEHDVASLAGMVRALRAP
ncbi:MAG: TIGR03617 family F420-dependent LLM class oxidoreductase [Gammaproteobacteria bacterium]|nr:TIGR03617 family F420-dependent LLM class oxidoreductase [Gammaproteobacteria bacterium]